MTKENFYQTLGQIYDAISSNDKIGDGEFNAKIGREPVYKDNR